MVKIGLKQHILLRLFMWERLRWSRGVACWPLIPKFAGSNLAEAVGFLRVNKNPQHVGGAWMFVCCDCCVLSGRGLCDELITRSEESHRLWCVVVCDLKTS
jgi:hypothetical protein